MEPKKSKCKNLIIVPLQKWFELSYILYLKSPCDKVVLVIFFRKRKELEDSDGNVAFSDKVVHVMFTFLLLIPLRSKFLVFAQSLLDSHVLKFKWVVYILRWENGIWKLLNKDVIDDVQVHVFLHQPLWARLLAHCKL